MANEAVEVAAFEEEAGNICGDGYEGERADCVRLATSLSYEVRLEVAESPPCEEDWLAFGVFDDGRGGGGGGSEE